MASPVLSSVDSILEHLGSLKISRKSSILISKLGTVRTFLLCTIHDKDENLGSFMARIEDVVCSNARKLEPYCLNLKERSSSDVVRQRRNVLKDFLHDIKSLEKDIQERYFTLPDFSRRSSLTADELLRLNSSIIGNIQDYQTSPEHYDAERLLSDHPIEDLLDMLVFLRNFIQFVKLPSVVEPPKLEDLLSHFEAVSVNAAHLFAHLLYTTGTLWDAWSKEKILVLLQKFQPFDPQACQIYTQALISSKLSLQLNTSTRDMEDGSVTLMIEFIDSLLVFFWQILQHKSHNVISRKDQLQVLYQGLRFLRTSMKEEPNRFDQKIRHLIREFICDAGIIIVSLYQTDVEVNLQDVLQVMEVIRAEIDGTRTVVETDQVNDAKELHGTSNSVTSSSSALRPDEVEGSTSSVLRPDEVVGSTSSALRPDEVVGFREEASSIIDRLTGGSKQLRIIAIVGMPGIGKTTLATKVYDHPSVTYYFHVRARCTFSQEFNKRKVLLELLNHLDSKLKLSADTGLKMSDQDLVEKLWRGLKGRRYLIFLDDVWDIEAWNRLQESIPNDCNGSRIVLTSRYSHVAPQTMLDREPHFLGQLTVNESWELLQKRLFRGKGCPPALHELGTKIAENCKGLPLTIIIVAGLLSTLEEDGWKEVLESLTSSIISSSDQCMNSLELSYKHLPDYLKPCFLYLGVFQEDEVVPTKTLIWLWIAEGFVQNTKFESSEEVGMNYMMDLISRSLLMVVKERSSGGVKTYRIHDLLLAFCITKAKEENFFHLLKGYNELVAFNEPPNLQRLCIRSKPQQLRKSRLFCPHVRSLLFFTTVGQSFKFDISFISHTFTSLRVLHIPQIHLGREFPVAILFLQQLRYLAIRGYIKVIPSSIDRLSNLEIFIVHAFIMDVGWKGIALPDTLWNLRRLSHVHIRPNHLARAYILNNPDSAVHNLESITGIHFSSLRSLEKELRMFPNLRRLKCRLHNNQSEMVILDFLTQLESFHLDTWYEYGTSTFLFPENLKKLTLKGGKLPWSKILAIGKLPNLQVLKLIKEAFSGETWDMEEGEYFLKLKFLKLKYLNIVKWTTSDDDHFPCLQKLVLKKCYQLKEIPSCLKTIPNLKMIEVSSCRSCIHTQVQEIQREQQEYGISDFSIRILQE